MRVSIVIGCMLTWALCLGCSGEGSRNASAVVAPDARGLPRPQPVTPAQVLEALEWDCDHLDLRGYATLFTDDYRFFFAPRDSAGNVYRNVPWTREDELVSATHLFRGGLPEVPPAALIRLDLDAGNDLPDPRPGKDPAVHRMIPATYVMHVVTRDRRRLLVAGAASFFVVRGDSASIPQDSSSTDHRQDGRWWWIERWDDDTVPGFAESPRPVRSLTWAELKARYR